MDEEDLAFSFGAMIGLICGVVLMGLAASARAAEIGISYGANPPWQGIHVKEIQADIRAPLVGHLWHKAGGGYWFESGEGGSGGILAYSLGTRVDAEPLYADMYWGLGYVPSPDMFWLSSPLEFVNDVSIGLSKDGHGLGLAYRHISNAGLVPPNRGRDFLLIQVRFGI